MSEQSKGSISPDKMIKQAQKTKGYLLKKSNGILGGWNQRYFIIFNGALSYYIDQALQKQKGQIKLKDIKSIILKETDLFILITSKRQYQFKCTNKMDRDLWVASLNLLKEYISDDDFTKKLIIKKAQNEMQIEKFQLCSNSDVRKVLKLMKLNLLAQQLDQSRIHQRIYCQKVQNGYYISVSIKCLIFNQIDQQILAQKYIAPYNFNKLYKIYEDGKIDDIGKMSQMQSLKTLQNSVALTFSDKKKILLPFKKQSQAYEISRKLCRCYEVAKQYYNPFKIVLKKNIDRLIFVYENIRNIFQQQITYKISEKFQRFVKQSNSPVEVFISEFRYIKRDLIQTEQACKVLSPTRDDLKFAYFRLAHTQIKSYISKIWECLFASFELKNLINFSVELYQYWLIVNPVVNDSTILEGCFDLNKFFMGRAGQTIRQKIHDFNAQKVQYNKVKNQPVGNEITNAFFEWLKQINCCLNETIPLQSIFQQYCKFYSKYFDQFLQYIWDISDKWNQILVIIGACNDLSRIRSYFKSNIGSELCKGIFAQKKFYTSCGNQIIKKINECLSNLIKRAFVIIFRTIDKKLLIKPFIEIDFSKICYEVLQRIQPHKTKLLQDIEYEMAILSFDQICFFLYTIFINKNIPNLKNVKQYYVKAIQKGLTQIEQFYCNIKTENYVKKYLKQVMALKQILICPDNYLVKYTAELFQTFGTSFNEQSLTTILMIRQTSQQNFKKLLQQCIKCLSKSPSSEDSESYIENPQIRSRKSTLTQSIYTISLPDRSSVCNQKLGRQGYLEIKKVIKGISTFFTKSYFRIRNGKMYQYYSPSSHELISSIDLQVIDYCYLDSQVTEKCVFVVIIQSTTYYFKAATRDQAGLWIQAIYSQIKHPLFENTCQYPEKQKKNALFKNLQAQLTTTSSNKRKTGENIDSQKFFQQKRERRQQMTQHNQKSSKQYKSPPKGKPYENKKTPKPKTEMPLLKKNSSKQDEGSCCTSNMF